MVKLFSLISGLFTATNHGSSFVSSIGIFFAFIGRFIVNAFSGLLNWLIARSWDIIKFVLGLMEAFEYMINSFIGIKTVQMPNGSYELRGTTIQDIVDYAKGVSEGQTTSFVTILANTFKALMGVAIVLLIIFTIVAMIKQEYTHATSGSTDPEGNNKKPIIMGMLKKMLYVFLLPLTMMFILTGVNSILAAFSRAMQGEATMTVASQLLASSTYDSNKYRYYAQQGRRIPIIIRAYDPNKYDADENEILMKKINSGDVQGKLKETASAIATNTTLPFAESVVYENNKLVNSTEYGDYYENFVCTAEQYQIMADFIDYAQKTRVSFQVKSIDDQNIDWKYVDSAVFNPSDVSLKINYRDASDINGNGKTSDSYTMEFSSSFEVTTPISDAMETIMALLGVGDYSDFLYKTMERDEDYLNVVKWQNEKVLIQLSEDFDVSSPSDWTRMDQLIMYEYYHFASNNTFGKYTIDDLKNGIELDAAQIMYREYYPEGNAYSPVRTLDCVKINGSYYRIVQDPYKTDKYGNVYYVLYDPLEPTDTTTFLSQEYARIAKREGKTAKLKLTGKGGVPFNLNNKSTWSYTDEILIYEFYKDLTYNNQLYAYDFYDFYDGVDVDVYRITHNRLDGDESDNKDLNGDYALINGTYYKLTSEPYTLFGKDSTETFLNEAGTYTDTYYYNFHIELDDPIYANQYGISTDTGSDLAANKFYLADTETSQYAFQDVAADDPNLEKYSSFSLKLSDNFTYEDVDTWTYKDYFIFYLYLNYTQIAGNLGLESLRISGVNGQVVKVNGEYYFQVKHGKYNPGGGVKNLYLYIDMDMVSKISNFIINKSLNHSLLLQTNLRGDYVDLFVNADEGKLLETETELTEFRFSEKFEENYPANWTVLDYILYTLSKAQIINTVEEIKENGYHALLYKTEFDDTTTKNIDETEHLYKFGSKDNDAKKYLSLQGVRALKNIDGEPLNFDTIYEFLNTRLLDYVAVLYKTNNAQLITDDYGIIDNLYEELSDYVFDVENIINRILSSKGFNLTSNTFEVYDHITEVTYKSSAKFEDLSTWTNFDAVMYYLTGSIRSSYTGNVIIHSSKQYFVYGKYAIEITNVTGNPLKATITDNNIVTSRESRIEAGTNVTQYYIDNYSNYVYLESEIGDKITKYATNSFKYTKTSTTKTELEVVYEALKRTAIANGSSVTFNAYSDGTNVYLQLEGKDLADASVSKTYYISVGTNYNNYISAIVGGSLNIASSAKIATKTTTYTAFNNVINDETNFSAVNYTKLDALIYRDLGTTEKANLSVYNFNGVEYVYTGKSYIKYNSSTTAQKIESFDAIDSDDDKAFIKALYNKYYKKYVKFNVSNTTFEVNPTTFKFTQTNPSNITKLTPLAIIFSSLGVFDPTINDISLLGYIGKSSKFTYFHYNSIINGETLDVYIDITDIGEAYYESGNTDTQYLRDFADSKYQMVFNYLLEKEPSLTTDNVPVFENSIKDIYEGYENTAEDLTSYIAGLSSLDLSDATSWNYLNILYYSLSGESTISSSQIIYVDTLGNKYIKVSDGLKTYFVKVGTNVGYDSNLTTDFTSTDVSYSLKDGNDYSPIGIVSYKLLGTETGTITHVTVDSATNLKFYFIVDDLGTIANIVYGIGTATIKNGVTKGYYTYNFQGSAGVADWTLFDVILAITRNSSAQYELRSNIHIYGNSAYVIVNGRYLNLSKLGLLTSAEVDAIYSKINLPTDVGGTLNNNTQTIRSYFDSTTEGYKALVVCNDEPVALPEPGDEPVAGTNDVQLKFSEDFKLDDYNTWMLSDYILYYMFYNFPEYFRYDPDNAIENFNDLTSQGYVPGKYWKFLDEDEFGNTELKEIYFIGVKPRNNQTILAVDAAIFRLCYSRILVGLGRDDAFEMGVGPVTFEISSTPTGIVPGAAGYPNASLLSDISLPKNVAMNSNDFIFENYYYFSLNEISVIDSLQNVTDVTISKIKKGSATTTKAINIALSSGFDINNRSTWTWLDFIIVYEFSNTTVRHNYFEGVEFNDLRIESYLPVFEEPNEAVIEINGNYYNLLNIGYTDADDSKFDESDIAAIRNSKTLKTTVGSVSNPNQLISVGSDKAFNIKTLYESTDYYVKISNNSGNTLNYSKTPDSILFSKNDIVTFMTVNTNIFSRYQINFAELKCGDNYSISNIVRQVNWPQKLMNDMQVIYPDLNWATLIATDGWLDMLGEFTSAQTSGEFVSEGNSANITAAGLVLSEFFVSVAKENTDVAIDRDYEYTPVFDENVIRSLMLAMLGEEEYNDLSMQGTVYIEMFNNMFLPVLEDIAKERGEEIVDGKIDSFYISIYKAYLSTLLLGSDMGEYFYKIATRVYSQYTILDALASASGDYAAYLDYINTLSNENGGEVTAFKYSSFHELCIYENSFTGNSNPTFTFNFEKTLKGLYDENITYANLASNGYTIDGSLTLSDKVNSAGAKKVLADAGNFEKVVEELNKKYKDIYLTNKSRVSDLNTDGYYCFMLDAYWSIKQNLQKENKADPVYLEIYYEYITGNIKRWMYSDSVSTDAASGYIPDFQDYIKQRDKAKKATVKAALGIYIPDLDQIDLEEEGSLWDKLTDLLSDALITSWTVLDDVFAFSGSQFTDAKRAYFNIINKSSLLAKNDLTEIKEIITDSVNGNFSPKYKNLVGYNKYENVDAWQRLNAIYEDISVLTAPLKEVMKLNPGEYYIVDGVKVAYKDPAYKDGRFSKAYTELLDLNDALGNYISSQKVLDTINKTCITFTLAQFGKNYVTDGYTFNVENRSYTMKSTASPERLAEYVYGGAFLAKYGVPASYTNSEYNGFVESYRVYDSEIKSLRTKLNVWTELRSFASKLASYTSRLYYLSNMNDLSNNVGDGILLTDFVNDGEYGASNGLKTLEHIILEYLIDSDLAADTLLRLSFGDSVQTLDALGCAIKDVYALAHYLEGTNYKLDDNGNVANGSSGCPVIVIDGTEYEMTSSFKRGAIKKYLELVADDAFYDSDGYYNEGTDLSADRIHKIFKKTISYLIVTEEEGESVSENAVNLDNINFKQFRQILMKALSDYQKNPTESDLENQNRYITLFNLVNAQFDHTYHNGTKVIDAGTSISTLYLKKVSGVMNHIFANSLGEQANAPIYSTLSTDTATRDIVLHLAGVENRPIEELVGLEYDNLYDRNGNYDEETGDVFVLTTYDEAEGKYYPILGRSNKTQISGDHDVWDYISDYGIDFKSKYYHSDNAYPIIAKGVIDAVGYPTAIKMVDGEIIYYRTSITTSGSVSEEAVSRTRKSAEVTTVGYTKYVDLSYAKPKSADSMAMFAGSTSMEYAVKAGYDPKFIQIEEAYSVSDPDNFDSIMVLDKFSAFYTLEVKQYFMFMLGFATLIPILFKATAQVLRRILDLILLILAGPVVISTMAINPDQSGKGNKIFDTWKNNLSDTLLHVFGYMIAFNIYYVLVSTVMGMDFVTEATMQAVGRVGGLTSILSESSINSLITYVYVVAAAGTIETSADLLVNIVTCGKSSKAFSTNMSGEVFADIKKMVTEVREIYDAVSGIASGQALTQLKDFAMQSAKNFIPGGQMVAGMIQKGQNLATDIKAKGLEKSAVANGMSPEVAKKMSKQFANTEKGQREQKRQNSANNANKFLKTTLGTGPMFEEPKSSGGGGGGAAKKPKAPKKPKAKKKGGGKKKK